MNPVSLMMICFVLMLSFRPARGQVSISADGSKADNSAIVDISSTTKGFLPPRMTYAQIAAIPDPASGLIVYCLSDEKYYSFVAGEHKWKEILFGSGSIVPEFNCGSSITKSHIAGAVAPVTKTVTYSTVSGVPGDTSKCWITSNLGADHQAGSVDDSTEASAGWYWQFNLRQGYSCCEGSHTLPEWPIGNLDENSDWLPANDPCNLEFGLSWRIPTYSEWFNVDAAGGWSNWEGPWNSLLKLHAAGVIQSDGNLAFRGLHGDYLSSSQRNNTMAYNLFFMDALSQLVNDYKSMGAAVRCIRE